MFGKDISKIDKYLCTSFSGDKFHFIFTFDDKRINEFLFPLLNFTLYSLKLFFDPNSYDPAGGDNGKYLISFMKTESEKYNFAEIMYIGKINSLVKNFRIALPELTGHGADAEARDFINDRILLLSKKIKEIGDEEFLARTEKYILTNLKLKEIIIGVGTL